MSRLLGVLGAVAFVAVLVAALARGASAASAFSVVVALASLGLSGLALVSARSQAESSRQQVELARDQAEHAGEQARMAAQAANYAYQPILLPVHDAVRVLTRAEQHFPAVDPFQVAAPAPSDRVLLIDRETGRAVLKIRNVGRGPALDVRAWLSLPGCQPVRLEGNPAIGPDLEERFSTTLSKKAAGSQSLRSGALASVWILLTAGEEKRLRDRTVLLEVTYASSDTTVGRRRVTAVFDPRGTGQWLSEISEEKEKGPDAGSGPRALST